METTKSELVGYADRLSAALGETVRFMVSASVPEYEATIVRLVHGDENPAGPGYKEEEVDTAANGRHRGRMQVAHAGSYVLVPDSPLHTRVESFSLFAWVWPTTPVLGREQGILAKWSPEA